MFLLCSLVRISTLGKRGFVDSLLTASLIIGIDSVRKKKCKQVALIGDFLENSPKTNIYHSHAQCLKVFISPYPLLSLAVFFAFFYVGDHFNTVSICISWITAVTEHLFYLFIGHDVFCELYYIFIFLPAFIKLVIFYLFIEPIYMDTTHFSFVYSLYIFSSFSLLFQLLYSVIYLFFFFE